MKVRKKDTPAGGRKKHFWETLLFLAVMVFTLRFCFSGQKPQEIWAAVKSMRGMSLAGAVALGLFFVCAPWARSNGCKSRTRPDSGKCIAEQQGCPP